MVGVEYAAGLGARMVWSIDVMDIGANPDGELSLVYGLGFRVYIQDGSMVGLGLAAGLGASFLTRYFAPRAINAEVSGSLVERLEW